MYKIIILILFILSAISLTSCLNSPSIKQVSTNSDNFDSIVAKSMFREFLNTAEGENPNYKYYSYMIFSENSSVTYDQRKAASKAFICEFSDSSKSMKMKLGTNELAVFYAPINPDVNLEELRNKTSPEAFLGAYNYDYARVIVNKIKQLKPNKKMNIAIISYPLPLGFNEGNINHLTVDALNVIDLSNVPAAQIRVVIERFRKSVTTQYQVKEVRVIKEVDPKTGDVSEYTVVKAPDLETSNKINWANKMRNVFASLGSFIEAISPTVYASSIGCS